MRPNLNRPWIGGSLACWIAACSGADPVDDVSSSSEDTARSESSSGTGSSSGLDASSEVDTSSSTEAATSETSLPDESSVSTASSSSTDPSLASTSTSQATSNDTGSSSGGAFSSEDESTGEASTSNDAPLSFEADIWPTFAMIRDPVFVYHDGSTYESCIVDGVCHGGERPGANLSMPDAQTAYDQLVDAPSRSILCDGTTRVVPGNPDESCLILFYEGRLQEELDWVDDAEIDLVAQWIAQGAQP